jgi:large subunit ribosomal protein L24e
MAEGGFDHHGKGQKFIAKDGKVHFFISAKADALFHQRIKPVKLRWTQAWRRMNKKGKADEQAKKRSRKVQKFQKAIVGMTLDDIKKKKAQKPELRKQAQEAAAKEAKARAGAKKAPSNAKATKGAPKAKASGGKVAKTGAAPAPTKNAATKGKR